MAGICYRKGYEKGLWYEIKTLEDLIHNPQAGEKDREYAKTLVRAYRKLSEKDYQRAIDTREKSKS